MITGCFYSVYPIELMFTILTKVALFNYEK